MMNKAKLVAALAGSVLVVAGGYYVVSLDDVKSGPTVTYTCGGIDVCLDGGKNYVTRKFETITDDAGNPVFFADYKLDFGPCFELVGGVEDACKVTDCKGCGPTVKAEDVPHECSCWKQDAGACRLEGKQIPPAASVSGAVGPGCTPSPCIEMAGDQGTTMPAECK